MKIFPRKKLKHPPENLALQAECAAIDTFNRAKTATLKRQEDIDKLKERIEKNGLKIKEVQDAGRTKETVQKLEGDCGGRRDSCGGGDALPRA